MSSSRPGIRVSALLCAPLLGTTLLTGCTSLPAAVADAKNLRVAYWDFRTDQQMVLVNESDPAVSGLYSKPLDNAATKIASDDEMHELVDFAASRGFFDMASSEAGPDPDMQASAFRMIVINADGTNYSFVLEPGLGRENPDAVVAFTEIQLKFHTLYNSIHQLQYLSTEQGGRGHFEREQERLRRQNQERLGNQGGNR